MKIRLDEHISPRVAGALTAFIENRRGYEVSHVRDAHPVGASDISWLRAFAAEGGSVIVSGDANILQRWPELVAYTETGLIGFFPQSRWNQSNGWTKAALLKVWWQSIVTKAQASRPGDTWRFPFQWTPSSEKFDLIRDPRVSGSQAQRTPGIVPAPLRHQFRPRVT